MYLGEVKYGVQMKKEELSKCLELSCYQGILALNLLEFLVTKEDCKDMTVYGHGKQKKERNGPKSQKGYKKSEDLNTIILI